MTKIHWQYRLARWRRDLSELRDDFSAWLGFAWEYTKRTTLIFASVFENYKGLLVNLLTVKRGRYARPFLNLSVFMLAGAGFVAMPIIKENHPIIGGEQVLGEFTAPSAVETSISAEEISISTAISEKPRDRVVEYTVQKGDTVSTVAEKFGVSAESIKWANDLSAKNPVLKIGQTLNIPPVSGVVHTVKKGETVYSIAGKFNTEAQNIVNWPFNEFTDLETFALETGQTLIVPGGTIGAIPADEAGRKRVVPRPGIIAKGDPSAGPGQAGKFLWPAGGRLTQYFVWYHKALDIANKGAPGIAAAGAGTVSYAGCTRYGYGCNIRIDHGNGYETLYAHLSRYYVEAGQTVARGEAIGQMGSTGRSTGTHLHFEIRRNGVLVNPLNYLE